MTNMNATADSQEQLMNKLAEGFGIKTKGQSLGEGAYSWVSQRVASSYSPQAEQLGRNLASSSGLSDVRVEQAGKYAGVVWRTAVPMGLTAYKSSQNIRNTIGRYLGLSNEYQRSLKASGARNFGMITSLNTDLEVINNERVLLGSKAKNDTKTMLSSLMLDVPNVLATHLQSVIDELNPHKSKKKKNKRELASEVSKGHKAAAKTVNENIDKWLDAAAVSGEGKKRKYSGLLNGVIKSFNDGAGLESLNNPKNRYTVLKDIKERALGTVVTTGASLLKPTLTQIFNISSDAAFNKPTAGKMIQALEKHLKKNASPVGLTLPGCTKKECTLEEYVMDLSLIHI